MDNSCEKLIESRKAAIYALAELGMDTNAATLEFNRQVLKVIQNLVVQTDLSDPVFNIVKDSVAIVSSVILFEEVAKAD